MINPIPIKIANIFITGGAGTLGRAIARHRKKNGWTGRLTVYSTSPWKHAELRRDFPDIQFVQGDIRNYETLRLAMLGHNIVIHAAAVKYIPDAEYASMDTFDVNVTGSELVCQAAREVGILHCLGVSTDKACHPANAYGASKMMMEKVFQEYARAGTDTHYNLVRFGNVLESVGSVIEVWKKAVENGKPVRITNPDMTRFWLSPSQAVEYVLDALGTPSGRILIPNIPALSIGKLLEYTMGEMMSVAPSPFKEYPIEKIQMRPGEKLHETLLTCEETEYAEYYPSLEGQNSYFILHPTTDKRLNPGLEQYTSENAEQLSYDGLQELLRDE